MAINKDSISKKLLPPSEYIPLLGKIDPPDNVLYSSDIKQQSELIELQEFFKKTDKKVKYFAGNYYIKKNELKNFQNFCKQIMTRISLDVMTTGKSNYSKVHFRMTSAQLKKLASKTSEKIRLVKLEDPVSISGFAKEEIDAGSILIYGGEIHYLSENDINGVESNNKTRSESNHYTLGLGPTWKNGTYFVDSESFRDFSSYLAHLTADTHFDKRYELRDPKLRKLIATENFVIQMCYLEDLQIIVPVLVATRKIKKNEIIGYDYNEESYFDACMKKEPCLLLSNGELLPKCFYDSRKLFFSIPMPEGRLSIKTCWSDVRKQLENSTFETFYGKEYVAFFTKEGVERICNQQGQRFLTMAPDVFLDINIMKKIAEKITEHLDEKFQGYIQHENKLWGLLLDEPQTQYSYLNENRAMALRIKFKNNERAIYEKRFLESGIGQFIGFNKLENKEFEANYLFVTLENACKLAIHYQLIDKDGLAKLKEKEDPKSFTTAEKISNNLNIIKTTRLQSLLQFSNLETCTSQNSKNCDEQLDKMSKESNNSYKSNLLQFESYLKKLLNEESQKLDEISRLLMKNN